MVVDCQYIYTNHDGKIVVRQKLDGAVQLSFSIPSGNSSAHIKSNVIALTDSFLCFPSVDTTLKQSQLNVLDKYDGYLVWSETFDSSIAFHPSIANDVIYIVEKEYFNSNPKKSRIWGFQLENGDSLFCDDSNSYMFQPIIANHTLFIPSLEGVQAFANLTVQVDNEIRTSLPNGFSLSQNYPNPFNPETTIWFNVKELCQVVLKVFNLMGQEVAHLVDKKYQPGQYEVTFNATGFSSGIYLYRIQMENFQAVKKMVLLE